MKSCEIKTMTDAEFAALPIGTPLIESYGSNYMYIRAKKTGPMTYSGVKTSLNYENGKWEDEPFVDKEYREEFSEVM